VNFELVWLFRNENTCCCISLCT